MIASTTLNQSADTLFVNARIVDGSGTSATLGSVAILGDRIVSVGPCAGWRGLTEVDCKGAVISPGFIDTHAHDESLIFHDRAMSPKTSQGVTTIVTGNCGLSLAPLVTDVDPPAPLTEIGLAADFRFPTFASFLAAIEGAPVSTNLACLLGHTTLRAATMSSLDRGADEHELEAMRALTKEAMDAGAFGVSSGLWYPPARAAPASEVIEILKVAAPYGGIYAAHMRDEADDIMAAIDETVEIASQGCCDLLISHHKLIGQKNFGRSTETLRHISNAATRHPISFDMYPYAAGSSMLGLYIVKLASRTMISWSDPYPEAAGMDLDDFAQQHGFTIEEAVDKLQPAGGIYFMMDEGDVQRILSHPDAMIGSDGIPVKDAPHPRLWGTFARILGHYVRDLGLLTLEDGVRRMTGLPATRLGFSNRGILAPGAYADIVVFDPVEIADTADFKNPVQAARGIKAVYVNGAQIRDGDADTGRRPGRILRPGVDSRTTRIRSRAA